MGLRGLVGFRERVSAAAFGCFIVRRIPLIGTNYVEEYGLCCRIWRGEGRGVGWQGFGFVDWLMRIRLLLCGCWMLGRTFVWRQGSIAGLITFYILAFCLLEMRLISKASLHC